MSDIILASENPDAWAEVEAAYEAALKNPAYQTIGPDDKFDSTDSNLVEMPEEAPAEVEAVISNMVRRSLS